MTDVCQYTLRMDEDEEIGAMRVCTEVLGVLDDDAKHRAVRWLADYYGAFSLAIPAARATTP